MRGVPQVSLITLEILFNISYRENGAIDKLKEEAMCRSIKTLFNFDPPGCRRGDPSNCAAIRKEAFGPHEPSRANEAAFHCAVNVVTAVARNLLDSLGTSAEPCNREVEARQFRSNYINGIR